MSTAGPLPSLSKPTPSTLVVLSRAASNYGLKLVRLAGELTITLVHFGIGRVDAEKLRV